MHATLRLVIAGVGQPLAVVSERRRDGNPELTAQLVLAAHVVERGDFDDAIMHIDTVNDLHPRRETEPFRHFR